MGIACGCTGNRSQAPYNGDIELRESRAIYAWNSISKKAIRKMNENDKQVERMVGETIDKGLPWTDPDFKPIQTSLYNPVIDTQANPSVFENL